jgi:LysM repeat protein
MVGDAAKFFGLITILVLCVLATDAGPCFSRTGEPAPVILLAAGPGKHVIKAGETLNLLALRYGVPAAAIIKANPGLDPARMQLGKVIVIPASGRGASDEPVVPVAPAAQGAQGIELRPEKAPQATQPVGAGLKGHDLPDSPGRMSPSQSMAPEKAPAVSPDQDESPRVSEPGPKRPAVEDIWPMQPSADAAKTPTRSAPAATGFGSGTAWFLGVAVAIVLILGLAFQGILSNFVAGCALLVSRLFRVGDSVMLAGIAGEVVALRRFYVVIRSETGDMVIVPNAKVISEIMVVANREEEEK